MVDQEITNATIEERGGENGKVQVVDGEAGHHQQDEPEAKQDNMVLLTAKREKDPFPKQNHLSKQVCLYTVKLCASYGAASRLGCILWLCIGVGKARTGRMDIWD